MKPPKKPPPENNINKNKRKEEDAKTEDEYSKALDEDFEDLEDGSSESEEAVEDDAGAGDENVSYTDRKGRVRTKTKKKRNKMAVSQEQARQMEQKRLRDKQVKQNTAVKRVKRRNDDLEQDEAISGSDDDNLDLDSGGSGSGGGDQNQDERGEKKSFQTEDINNEEMVPLLLDEDGNKREKGKRSTIKYLQEFLEDQNPQESHKETIRKILNKIFEQCIKGLQHFSKETKQHQSLGKSANICKHALSALERDNIEDAKKLIRIITPKK